MALGPDGLECPEPLQVFQDEGVEGLPGDRQSDDEADDGHQHQVRADAGLVFVELGDLLDEFLFRQGQVAEPRDLGLDPRDVRRALRLHQDVGRGEAHGRDVLHGLAVGRVERGHPEEPARGDFRDAHDEAAVVVHLEFGADLGVLQLAELRVTDDDEGALRVDVLDFPRHHLGASEEARVVEPEDGHGLVAAVPELHQRRPGVQGHGVLHTLGAARGVQHVAGHRQAVRHGVHRGVHDPDAGPDVGDGRRGLVQDPGEERRHLHHQEHGERDAHEQRGELPAVVHEQLEGEPQHAGHEAGSSPMYTSTSCPG